MRHIISHRYLVLIAFGLLQLALVVRPCTIFEFADSGFAANAIHLMHAVPIFDGNNGTFFLDNTQFAYKCEEGGGWHDFFAYQDHLVPWSAAKERAGGEECIRHSFRGVDDVLHVNLKAGWEPYNAAGVSQASSIYLQLCLSKRRGPCKSSSLSIHFYVAIAGVGISAVGAERD